jgi:hypothetical protein
MFLVPDAARNSSGLVPDDATRKQLVESLERRNAESHPLPAINNPDVVVLGEAASAETVEKFRQRTVGSSALSLPGYSDDRHALVYGSYSCGSLCGYGWLFVLERSDGQWRVKSATVTSIA